MDLLEDFISDENINDTLAETPRNIGAIDAISAAQIDKFQPWQALNPYKTMERASQFLSEVIEPLGFEPAVHIQAGILNPPTIGINAANKAGINIRAGDIAYLTDFGETVKDLVKTPSVDSIGYTALQIMPLPSWAAFLHTKSITTLINGTLPTGDTKIIRACTELIANGQFDQVINHIKSLGNDIVLALEINSKYHTPEIYLQKIRELADMGLPVGISFDTAGMVTADAQNPQNTDLGAIKRWYDTVLKNKELLKLLYCIEIDPISASGERHAGIEHLDGQIDGMMSRWNNSQAQHNTPHFVVETHPKEMDDFLRDPSKIKKILSRL